MAQANTTSLTDLFKEVYIPGVNSQINNETPLLSALESDSSSVQRGEHGGKYTVIGLKLGNNTAAAPTTEAGTIIDYGRTRNGRATVDLTQQYAHGSVTGFADAKSASDMKALVKALNHEIAGVKDAMVLSVNRQAHGASHGGFATLSSVSGSGPWTAVIPQRVIESNWLEEGHLVQLASVSSGTATVLDSGAVLEVTAIDPDTQTVTLTQVSGSSTPANGEYIVVKGSANACLQGLDQIVSDVSTSFQGINRSTERRWRANRVNAGGAFTFPLFNKLRNTIKTRSGNNPDFVLTTYGIEQAAYNDLQDQIRYTDPDKLKWGTGVVLPGPGNVQLIADHNCKAGSLYAINREDMILFADGDYRFLDQGGSEMMRFQAADFVQFILARYMQLGVKQLNSHGELYGLTDSSYFGG